jgi:hypothetical protein
MKNDSTKLFYRFIVMVKLVQKFAIKHFWRLPFLPINVSFVSKGLGFLMKLTGPRTILEPPMFVNIYPEEHFALLSVKQVPNPLLPCNDREPT